MSESGHVDEPTKFTPKDPPKLNPPKEDPITVEELAKCDGKIVLRNDYHTELILANLPSIPIRHPLLAPNLRRHHGHRLRCFRQYRLLTQ
jgi:hypothetical protein